MGACGCLAQTLYPVGRYGRVVALINVTFETTAGELVFELDSGAAPLTVRNFREYVRSNFYAGLVFHRVIKGFVAQAGGYRADKTRKMAPHPPISLEKSPLKHTDMSLGMARLPEPNTATSEFYVSDGAQPDLDGQYCVFGRLAQGRDTIRRILDAPTGANDWPNEPVIIRRSYEGLPDPTHASAKFELPGTKATPQDVADVRKAARLLRGRAALLRARRPMMAMSDVEAAIAQADRTGKAEDLDRARLMLEAREKR